MLFPRWSRLYKARFLYMLTEAFDMEQMFSRLWRLVLTLFGWVAQLYGALHTKDKKESN